MNHDRITEERRAARAPRRRQRDPRARRIACGLLWTAALLALPLLARPLGAAPVLLFSDESAAYSDAPASLVFNPASHGVRYRGELAFTLRDLPDEGHVYRGAISGRSAVMTGTWSADQKFLPGIAAAWGEDRLRWGLVTSWVPSGDSGTDPDYRLGTLARPVPWLSLGGVADHLSQPDLADGRAVREYTVGLGLRPLAWSGPAAHEAGTRFTITADARMEEVDRIGDARYRIGAEVEPIPGLALRGSYLTEERTFQLGVSWHGVQSGYHGESTYDQDQARVHTTHSVSLHPDEERTAFVGPRQRRVALVRAGGNLGDDALSGYSIYGSHSTTPAAHLHRQLERALEDPLTRGVLLDVRGVGNSAQIEELRPRIARLREAGKPVVAYMERGGGRGDFYLASACDRIVTTPEAFFAGLGLRAERRYYRKVLDDWGVRIDRASEGKYKDAYRNFSVDSTPAPDREAIESRIDQIQEIFVSTVSADRGMPRERLLPLLDGRRWPPVELMKAGLIDTVGYREDALRILGRLAGMGAKPKAERLDQRQARRVWTVPTRLAIVYASGAIESGASGNDLLLGPYMGSETMIRQIERAFSRPDVKAVVLRIESPGGSSLASDLIHHALVRMRGNTGKPLIVSMGGSAASGGYHIALPARKIFANRSTRTGSIGVVFVKPSLEGWYERLKVRQDVFERGAAMRGLSFNEDWDREMQASADSAIMREYREFVQLVATSRGLTWDQAHAVAQGRVWLGEEALEKKLIDGIGGLEEAIAEARKEIGVPPGEKLQPVEYRRPRPGLLQRLVGSVLSSAWERSAHLPESGAPLFWMEDDPEF